MVMGQMQKTIKLNMKTAGDLWPYQVIDEIQKVMEADFAMAGYPNVDDGWDESVRNHLEAAFLHIQHLLNGEAVLKGDGTREDHLAHAFTRLMMAVAIERGYTLGDDEFAKRNREVEEKIRKGKEK